MIFKLNEVFNLTRSLPVLTSKELPVKVSYRLFKLLKACSVEMESLEKARVKLVEKYSEEPEEGKERIVSDDKKEEFQKEFEALLSEEVEIEFAPFSLAELGNISLSANDLVPLEKIIKEK